MTAFIAVRAVSQRQRCPHNPPTNTSALAVGFLILRLEISNCIFLTSKRSSTGYDTSFNRVTSPGIRLAEQGVGHQATPSLSPLYRWAKRIMFGSNRRKKRVAEAFRQIAEGCADTSKWLAHEDELQWAPAQMWTMFCASLPAFSFVIYSERTRNANDADAQKFISEVSNSLFVFFHEYSKKNRNIPLRNLIPVASERQRICSETDLSENMNTDMETVIRILFPSRMQTYQQDFAEGMQATGVHAPFDLPAMRLAAHLVGIETPTSLAGRTAEELGIMAYGQTIIPLVEFCTSYR
ncbi:MAG: hypothetical protein WD342_21395 [Verrucomicrobiales bacterium]